MPQIGGRVVVGTGADVKGLNPLLSADPRSLAVSGQIYQALVMDNPRTGEPTPRLAESWSVTPDGSSLTLTLRDGLVWSDGSPLTTDDVVFTLMALLRSKTSYVKGAVTSEVVGAREFADGGAQTIAGLSTSGRSLTIRLTRPVCTALVDIGEIPVLPKSVFGKYMDTGDPSKTIDAAPENNAPPLAAGPFRFQEWVPNDHVTLARNDRFFLGPARLTQWIYRVVPAATGLAAALNTGEVDVAAVSPAAVDGLRAAGVDEILASPGTGYTFIAWNELRGGKEFFRDNAVRQALSYGINWDQIIATVFLGRARRVVSHTPSASWAYDPTGLNDYQYDPAKAGALLDQAGWVAGPDGIREKGGQRLAFTLISADGNPIASIQEVAVEQYRQIGVEVTPRVEAFEAILDRFIRSRDPTYGSQGGHDYDAILTSWGQVGPDPDAFWYWDSASILGGAGNRGGYANNVVDQAIVNGLTHCSPVERKAAYHQMDLQLNGDQPVAFGLVGDNLLAVSKQIHGVDPGAYSFWAQWNVETWWRSP